MTLLCNGCVLMLQYKLISFDWLIDWGGYANNEWPRGDPLCCIHTGYCQGQAGPATVLAGLGFVCDCCWSWFFRLSPLRWSLFIVLEIGSSLIDYAFPGITVISACLLPIKWCRMWRESFNKSFLSWGYTELYLQFPVIYPNDLSSKPDS